MSIREMIVSHRKSSIIFVAFDSGLFKSLFMGGKSVDQLAEDLELDKKLLFLFLKNLINEGIVEEKNAIYELTTNCKKELKNYESYETILKYEYVLQNKWLHSKEIMASLQNGLGVRTYDIQGMKTDDKLLYYKSMYNDNITLLAKQIKRVMREADTLLEFGRSSGLISVALEVEISMKKIILCQYEEDIYRRLSCHCIKSLVQLVTMKELENQSLDLIVIHNTIHYLEKEELLKLIICLKNLMKTSSKLIIGDIFMDVEGYQNSYLIDWITHGGTNFLYQKEVIKLLLKNGFDLYNCITMKQIPITLLVFQKGFNNNKIGGKK